jgi:hypothetical protein
MSYEVDKTQEMKIIQEIRDKFRKGLEQNHYSPHDIKVLTSFFDKTYSDPIIAADLFKKLDIEISGNGVIDKDDFSKLRSYFLEKVGINEEIHNDIKKTIRGNFNNVKESISSLDSKIQELGYNVDFDDVDSAVEIIESDPELSDYMDDIVCDVEEIVKDLNHIVNKCNKAGFEFSVLDKLKEQCKLLRSCIEIEEKQNLRDVVERISSSGFRSAISGFAGVKQTEPSL